MTVNSETQKPNQFRPIYKSECKKPEGTSYRWNIVMTDTDTLADSNPDNTVMFQLFQFSHSGTHKCISKAECKFSQFEDADGPFVLQGSGHDQITVGEVVIKKKESFLDYIFGGCEMGV